jgi:hypothetical protein
MPPEATVDWAEFTVAAHILLSLFPAEVIGERYNRLFHPKRRHAA